MNLTEDKEIKGFPGSSVVKNPPANARETRLIPESGRTPEERNGNPLQYSCLENSMERGPWWAIIEGVAKSWACLGTHRHILPHTVNP